MPPDDPYAAAFHHSSSRIGLRARRDLEAALQDEGSENVSERKDPIDILKTELKEQDISANLLQDSPFLTLESLAAQIEATIETGNQEYYIQNGLIPFRIHSKIQGKDHGVVAIRIYKKDSAEVVSGTAIKMLIDEFLSQIWTGQDPKSVDYVLVQSNDFAEIARLIKDPKVRAHFASLDGETSARDVLYHIVVDGIKNGASDVHMESRGDGTRLIRFRIDGVLNDRPYALSEGAQKSLVNVIKTVSLMDITEKRRPQDGIMMFDDETLAKYPRLKGYSVRASTMPTLHEESAVLRILQYANNQFDVKNLGFTKDVFDRLHEQICAPYGLILVTGPTGSGKTTTLYSILQTLNTREKKIITAEDPIEMDMAGINQVQVDKDAGRDFETILKGALRQDPDIILVGEIRDQVTAELAMRAANTGHLVLSTLHTNDAISSLLRLYEFNIPKSEIQAAFLAALSQRLVRKLCAAEGCSDHYDASVEMVQWFGASRGRSWYLAKEGGVVAGKSCRSCEGIGFHGRTVIGEIWIPGDLERKMIYDGVTSHQEFFDQASINGMRPMVLAGMEKVLERTTTIDELKKVIPALEFIRRKDLLAGHLLKYQAKAEQGTRAYTK